MIKARALKRNNPRYVAQAILSRSDHSSWEVRKKMLAKGFNDDVVQETLVWLRSRHLINDRELAKRYVERTLSTKPVGPRWLKAKLSRKKIELAIIEEAIDEAFEETSECDRIRDAIEAWHHAHLGKSTDNTQLARFLMARGFTSEVIWDELGHTDLSSP